MTLCKLINLFKFQSPYLKNRYLPPYTIVRIQLENACSIWDQIYKSLTLDDSHNFQLW